MKKKYEAIIFDCDGTLLNTIFDLTDAVNYALCKIGIGPINESETIKHVGNGISKLVYDVLPFEKKDFTREVLNFFNEYYSEHFVDKTLPYDGIISTLAELKKRGYKLALVSNKRQEYLDLLYDKFFADTIDFYIGETNIMKSKPEPDMVNYIIDKLNVERSRVVYVGDSIVDVVTAKNANVDGIFCLWGYSNKESLIEHGAEKLIGAPYELIGIV